MVVGAAVGLYLLFFTIFTSHKDPSMQVIIPECKGDAEVCKNALNHLGYAVVTNTGITPAGGPMASTIQMYDKNGKLVYGSQAITGNGTFQDATNFGVTGVATAAVAGEYAKQTAEAIKPPVYNSTESVTVTGGGATADATGGSTSTTANGGNSSATGGAVEPGAVVANGGQGGQGGLGGSGGSATNAVSQSQNQSSFQLQTQSQGQEQKTAVSVKAKAKSQSFPSFGVHKED